MARKALLVGIEYRALAEKLVGAFNDVEFWERFLLDRNYDVTILREYDATKSNIKDAFEDMIDDAVPGDLLFFMFSGHCDYDSSQGTNELLTYDLKTIKDEYLDERLSHLQAGVTFNGFVCASHSGTVCDLRYNAEYYRVNGDKDYDKTTHSEYGESNANITVFSGCGDYSNVDSFIYAGKKYSALTAAFIEKYKAHKDYTYRKLLKRMFYFYEDEGIYVEGNSPMVTPQLSYGISGLDDTVSNFGDVVPDTRETFFEKYKFINDVYDYITGSGNMLAFLGAEGYGCYSSGGRGGNAYWVTTLEDNGEPGSLRYVVDNQELRPVYVFFDVEGDGVISLNEKLTIRYGQITIDGLSPFATNGITLTNGGVVVDYGPENVIIRNLKIRPHQSLEGKDALSIRNAKNVIVDHCSVSWSGDEVLSVNSSIPDEPFELPLTDLITIQNCFIYEPFGFIEDEERVHRFIAIISSTDKGNVCYIKNLCAHGDGRNPRIGNTMDELAVTPSYSSFINNLVYNWGYVAGYNGETSNCPMRFNFIKNHYISGPDTLDDTYIFIEKGSKESRAYFNKNMINGSIPDGGRYAVVQFAEWTEEGIEEYKNTSKCYIPQIDMLDPDEVEKYVLYNSGVVLPQRDANDLRIIEDVKNKTGHVVTNPDDYHI